MRAEAWPLPNAHLGVSVENEAAAAERIPSLRKTPAAIRWISYEPALEPVDWERWLQFALAEKTRSAHPHRFRVTSFRLLPPSQFPGHFGKGCFPSVFGTPG